MMDMKERTRLMFMRNIASRNYIVYVCAEILPYRLSTSRCLHACDTSISSSSCKSPLLLLLSSPCRPHIRYTSAGGLASGASLLSVISGAEDERDLKSRKNNKTRGGRRREDRG